ncbi:hypothetical protein DOY81_013766 [Sarcophaga bullata]|nr:hypothetical protein DOY81_013766 [Sarcophaga bullata]
MRFWVFEAKTFKKISTKALQNQANPILTSSVVPIQKFEKLDFKNEPILEYKASSQELTNLEKSLEKYKANVEDIPIVIGGKEIKTNKEYYQVIPYDHNRRIAKYYYADQNIINQAIKNALETKEKWDNNAYQERELTNYEPLNVKSKIFKNHMIWRALDGFIAAISPFNFTSIGIMREAGLPDGVVNFVPSDGVLFGNTVTYSQNFGGINFTGSLEVFRQLWKLTAKNLDYYKAFPRLSGECGGKNYHFVHPSADPDTVVACTIRSAFEFSGQKCSACSRLYVPENLWNNKIKKSICELTSQLLIGDVCNYSVFTSAVIDEKAFLRITEYIDYAKTNPQCDVIVGGRCSNLKGYFIDPTIVEVRNPDDRLFKDEIFGPLLAVYVYKDNELDKAMQLIRDTPKYGLTGAVFATDEKFLKEVLWKFRTTVGNFYINDKSTGAVVGQQPFGGSKLSGTNDKPGCPFYLLRWTSPQSIKESFVAQTDIYYPYMQIC